MRDPPEAVARFSTAAPSNSTAPGSPVKYYIVGVTGSGEREHLFGIAARTLGDGRRYMEIFEINLGRPQPDGRRLEDPLLLLPGWVLILPPDASGEGVHVGTPPVFGSATQEPAHAGDTSTSPLASDGALRALMLTMLIIVLCVAVLLLRRGRRLTLATSTRPTWYEVADRGRTPPSIGPAPLRPAEDREHARDRTVAAAALAGVRARPAAHTTTPVTEENDAEPDPIVVDPVTPRVEATLRSGPDQISVHLVGARPGADGAFAWRGRSGPRRPGQAVIRIGDHATDALFVDLAVSPDAISLSGTRSGVRRQVRSIALQLAAAGVATVAVGDVAMVADQATYNVESLSELVDSTGQPPLLVVLVGELAAPDVPVLHRLISQRQPRVVPVVVGSGRRARWSISVGHASGREDQDPSA